MNPHVKKLLTIPATYRLLTFVLGGMAARAKFVREHIRAQPGERVLDIGCGPADIVAVLPSVAYTGFDINPEYIESAKRNYGDRGEFYCQRVNDESLTKHKEFDIVLAIGILHHLDDDEAARLFALARSALAPSGRLIALDPCYAAGQSRVARFLISRDRGDYVRDADGYTRIARSVFSSVTPTVRSDLLRVPYTHLVLECRQ